MKRKAKPSFRLGGFLPHRLAIVAQTARRAVAQGSEYELSEAEWRVVMQLGYTTAIAAGTIGEATALDKVQVSRAVGRLEQAGLVRREPNPLDQRGTLVALTASGRAAYDDLVRDALAVERSMLEDLGAREVKELHGFLDRIEGRLRD
jgi:DNA-binding MarR family transcriptional regulator